LNDRKGVGRIGEKRCVTTFGATEHRAELVHAQQDRDDDDYAGHADHGEVDVCAEEFLVQRERWQHARLQRLGAESATFLRP